MALIHGARFNNLYAVKQNIATGADANAVDGVGRTALWWASYKGHIKCVTALLEAKADVNNADVFIYAPLHAASRGDHVECVQVLIQHKANVNALNIHGQSSLCLASLYGYLACVRALVANGAEIDGGDTNNWTPLKYAIEYGCLNVAEFLLHSGAKMENISPTYEMPDWMTDIIRQRRNAMDFTLVLKALLKRRLGLSKDVTHLIALCFWRMRLK
jgi:ankyrin repeat protein